MGLIHGSVSCILLALIAFPSSHGDLLDALSVQSPERMIKRSLPNYHDCPPGHPTGPQPPSPMDFCPPGTRPETPAEQPPHGIPPEPCDPWVGPDGDCHINDIRYDGDRCRAFYGEKPYKEWQDNYALYIHRHRTSPVGQRPSEPVCIPAHK